jgi:hypothetical protein
MTGDVAAAPRPGSSWRALASGNLLLVGGVTLALAVVFGGPYLRRGTIEYVLEQPLFILWLGPLVLLLWLGALVEVARRSHQRLPWVAGGSGYALGACAGAVASGLFSWVQELGATTEVGGGPVVLAGVVVALGVSGAIALRGRHWSQRVTRLVATLVLAFAAFAAQLAVEPLGVMPTVLNWWLWLAAALPLLGVADAVWRGLSRASRHADAGR